jgi:putative oxidoreductase
MNPAAQSQALLVGRILIAVLFLVFGIRAVLGFTGSVGYFTKLGFPAPQAMVILSILVHIGGGVLLLVGWQTRRAAWLLIALVVIATLMAHRFWESEPAQYVGQLTSFLKNVAIVGGLLYVAAFGAGALSVDGRARTS